ncbi:MAG: DUF5675 family protein [Bacteroidota bacterium]
MNRFIALLFIALVTFVIILLVTNPDAVNDIWLYVVGFAGAVGSMIKGFFERLKGSLAPATENKTVETARPTTSSNNPNHAPLPQPPAPPADHFDGITLSLLRYTDDGFTTLGLLYIDDQYFCFTLEDTFREQKIAKKTRIPAGTYEIKFRKEKEGEQPSEKTVKYRKLYPQWFTYHLMLQNVPGFNFIYIHVGNDNEDTDGCILVADSVSVTDKESLLANSTKAFQRLYLRLSEALNNEKKVRIIVKDEQWVKKARAA